MKKILLLLAMTASLSMTSAGVYPYVVIRDKAGKECVVKSDGLRFGVAGSTLNVNHLDGDISFDFSELSTMRFLEDPAGINVVETVAGGSVEVFTPTGIRVGRFASVEEAESSISGKGMYILKSAGRSVKVIK